ncbi:MAG: WG repeat-containing protein [Bacteroidales bacterium]|nr:WG repeat-containing protein [Bacteroidales bacterium]
MVKFIHFKRTVVFIGFLILSSVSFCSYGQDLERRRDGNYGLWGYVEKSSGKIVIPYWYEYAKDFSEGLAAVRKLYNEWWGFIDKTGKVVIPFEFRDVKSFSDGLAAMKLKGKWGFIDTTSKVVIPFAFRDVGSFFEGWAAVRTYDGKWGFIDKTGEEVIPCQFQRAESFTESLAAVKLYGKWGFIDKAGNAATPFDFQDVGDFSDGLAAVKLKGKWGFIDKSGNAVVPIMYEAVGDFLDGYVVVQDGKFLGAVDKNGTVIAPCIYSNIYSVDAVVERERSAQLEREKAAALKREETAQQQEVTNSTTTDTPDIIMLKNGSEIKAKVDEITLSEIKYKQFDYLDGPTRAVAKSDVFAIIYENGTREVVSATAGTNTKNTSNVAGEVSIGFSPVIYVEEDLFMFGLCGKLRVGIAKSVRLEGSFTYHFPKTEKYEEEYLGIKYKEEEKFKMWDVNLDMQAIVTKSDKFLLYPLIGLRVTGIKLEDKVSALGESDSDSDSKTAFGLNSGFGFDVRLSNKVYFNLESKYKLSFIEKETVSSFTASMGLIIKF